MRVTGMEIETRRIVTNDPERMGGGGCVCVCGVCVHVYGTPK